MNQNHKDKFEASFQNAIKASLGRTCMPSGLRERITESLKGFAERTPVPNDVSLDNLDNFQFSFSQAVEKSQDWSPTDEVAFKVEQHLSSELKRDLLSERAVHFASHLENKGVCPNKMRFLGALRGAVQKSQSGLITPTACRQRIEVAIGAQKRSKVLPFPTKAQWKRGIGALASVAAGFALLMGSLLGSADKALANSVRRDHQMCCREVKKLSATSGLPESLKKLITTTDFGSVPTVSINSEWKLVISRMCLTDDGHSMVHDIYHRGNETLSLHLFPPESREWVHNLEPEELADGDFPVLAWEKQGWTITACSTELNEEQLKAAISR